MASPGLNIVWGEINVVSIITLMSQFIILVVFITRASDRSIRAEQAAEKAGEAARKAHERLHVLDQHAAGIKDATECAKSCKDQISILVAAFSAYRESVAMNFVSRDELRNESRDIEKKIEDLGKFIEKLIDARGPVKGGL